MNQILPILLITLASSLSALPPDTCRQEAWVTDAAVTSINPIGDRLYLTGIFKAIGPYTGCGVPLDAATGEPQLTFPKFAGAIAGAFPDGHGGWYVAGTFALNEDIRRDRIVHVLADNSIDPIWKFEVNRTINGCLLHGNTLFIWGFFTNINSLERKYIAAIDISEKKVTAWNPGLSQHPTNIAAANGKIYITTLGDSIGGISCRGFAVVDSVSGGAVPFVSDVDGSEITNMAIYETTLYLIGRFRTFEGQTRNCAAAIDTRNNALTAWSPDVGESVEYIAVDNGIIYLAGVSTVNGKTRPGVAAVNGITGDLLNWIPKISSFYPVMGAIAVDENQVYVSGRSIGSPNNTRFIVAAFDKQTGRIVWEKDAPSFITKITPQNGKIFAGGSFHSIGTVRQSGITAVDLVTGHPIGWGPDFSSGYSGWSGKQVAQCGSAVIISRGSDSLNGELFYGLAGVDYATGKKNVWLPEVNGSVSTLESGGDTLFVAGQFRGSGTTGIYNIHAFVPSKSTAPIWSVTLNNNVKKLEYYKGNIYACGIFDTIAGERSCGFSVLDASTGKLTEQQPVFRGRVNDITIGKSILFACGEFDTVNGQPRKNLVSFDPGTGQITEWNPTPGVVFENIVLSGKFLFATQTPIDSTGHLRSSFSIFDIVSGVENSGWQPNRQTGIEDTFNSIPLNRGPCILEAAGGALYLAGSGYMGQVTPRPFFAQFGEYTPDSTGNVIAPHVSSKTKDTGNHIDFTISNRHVLRCTLPNFTIGSISIYNLYGARIAGPLVVTAVKTPTIALQTQQLPPGAYMVVLQAGRSRVGKKWHFSK